MYEIRYIEKDDYYPFGSDYTVFIKDLKTIRGVINRLKNYKYIPKNCVKIQIFTYNRKYIYDEDKKLKVLELYKNQIPYSLLYIKQAN